MKKRNSKVWVVCVTLIVLFFVFQYNLSSSPTRSNTTSSSSPGIKSWKPKANLERDPLPPSTLQSPQAKQIICDRSHNHYDLCTINGSTVFDPTTSTFYLVDPTNLPLPPCSVEKIRPYTRKGDDSVMKRIKEITITSGPPSPSCGVQHNIPALVFSAGGYTGNFFHEFNDGFIPLFITVNSIFQDSQDIVLVISKARDWWVGKYVELLGSFSKHPIINLDNETSTHCFPSVTLGLISHGIMTIDPKLMPSSKTFTHFREFLDKAYGHGHNHPTKFNSKKSMPRLVLVSRSGRVGRVIMNENYIKQAAEKIGFEVITFLPTSETILHEAYALINSSEAMIGVHGAALTHSLFLRPGSVFLQVVPLGTEWVSEVCFGIPARAMGLEYMEYRIGVEESSLIDKYDKNSSLVKDPRTFQGRNWSSAIMDIYLKEQNVRIDLVRFMEYLNRAYNKAKGFMDKERRASKCKDK